MNWALILLAALSIWDYPSRQLRHEALKRQFVAAVKEGDTPTMTETCRKGVALLPEDPTWQYNLACSLAYQKKPEACFEALEHAIELGFRNADMIAADSDFKRVKKLPRFKELVELAREQNGKPVLAGPMAKMEAAGVFGTAVALGGQNLSWDFENGCFEAHLKMAEGGAGANSGDLYMNRDDGHSMLKVEDFPGLTRVRLDSEGHAKHADVDYPNILFPYPVFGNASRAYKSTSYWRSLPRAMMTGEKYRMRTMQKFYRSNQFWVFPSHEDTPPLGKHGDVFASMAPYWIVTAGRSWSDQYYLRAALRASASFKPEVKKAIVQAGLLSPTIQTIIRKSLYAVTNETVYLTRRAHPSAFPSVGLDLKRLEKMASEMTIDTVPPVVTVSIGMVQPKEPAKYPELTYATAHAWAFVLRAEATNRTFIVNVQGAEDYAFSVVHGDEGAVKILKERPDTVRLDIDRTAIPVTNRLELAVFGKRAKSQWGAPSFVSFATVDPDAPYSDPVLTPKVSVEGGKK